MANEEETMSYDEAADTLGLSKAAREGVDMLEQHKRDMQAAGVANRAGVDPTKLGGSTTQSAAYGRAKPIGTDLGKPLGTPMSEVNNSSAQTADGRPVEEQASTRMMNLMNRGVTTKGLEKAGTGWDAILKKETSDKEAVQQTNFAAFAAKAQKDKDRLKGKANDLILKAAGDIYARMVDQSNAGDKTGIVKDGDNYYRAQSVTDPEVLRMVNEAPAKLGMKDSVKGIAVKMQVNKETGETYGDPVFDITMQKDGYIKDGGAIQRSPMMTLADIQRLQEKAYRGMGVANPAEETTARFGDHLTMRKFRAEALAAAANPKSELESRAMGVKETEAGAKQTEAEAKKTLSEAQAKAYGEGVLALGGGARLTRAQLADNKQMNDLAFKAYKLAWDSAKTDADREALRDSAAWMNNWIAQKRGEASQAQGGQPEPTADNIMDDQYKTKGGRVNPGAKGGATTPPPAQTSAPTQTAQPAQAAPAPEAQTQPTATETPVAPVKSNAVVTPEIMQAAGSAFGGDINSAFGEISSQQKQAEEAKAASEAKKTEEEKSRKDAASKQRAEYAQNLRERLSKKGWAPRLVNDEVSRALLKFDRMSDDEKKKAHGFESDELKKRQMRAATDAEAEKRRKVDQEARDAESRKMSSQLQKLDGKQGISHRDMTDAEKKAVEDERKYIEQLKRKGLSNSEAQRKLKEYRAARDAESRKMSGRLERLNGKKGISGK